MEIGLPLIAYGQPTEATQPGCARPPSGVIPAARSAQSPAGDPLREARHQREARVLGGAALSRCPAHDPGRSRALVEAQQELVPRRWGSSSVAVASYSLSTTCMAGSGRDGDRSMS